jgi:hypothetical protein
MTDCGPQDIHCRDDFIINPKGLPFKCFKSCPNHYQEIANFIKNLKMIDGILKNGIDLTGIVTTENKT